VLECMCAREVCDVVLHVFFVHAQQNVCA